MRSSDADSSGLGQAPPSSDPSPSPFGSSSAGPSSSSTSARRFAEIPLSQLPEVMNVAKEAMDVRADAEAWAQVRDAVQEKREERERERAEWGARLEALTSQLEQLRSTHPRASWRTPQAHEQQLASYGQRTLEMAKQVSKLETAISRAETDARECREELERLERAEIGAQLGVKEEDEDEEGDEEDEERKREIEEEVRQTCLSLQMFRKMGFQPNLQITKADPDPDSSNAAPMPTLSISTLFVRSDANHKATTFNVEAGSWEGMSEEERVRVVNEMWDAVE